MRRTVGLALVVGTLVLGTSGAAHSAPSAGGGACVVGGGCYAGVQAAIDAAPDGGRVRLAPGTYAGGLTISRGVSLVGAGARRTTIRGGGPVLTVARPSTAAESVVLSGLTVTGGDAHSDGVNAYGGGILTSSQATGGPGASLTLRDAVVRGNRTAPGSTVDSPDAVCPGGPCPYAGSFGGGIDASGPLTLLRSVVRGNRAGGVASDADGGGIAVVGGPLVLRSSTVSGNVAAPARIGRYAEGGGIFVGSGDLTVEHSRIVGNSTRLVTSWPQAPQGQVLEMSSHGGGIQTSDGGHVLIDHSVVSDNATVGDDPAGEVAAYDSALLTNDSDLVLRDSRISHNTVVDRSSTSADIGPSGTAVEVDAAARITRTTIVDNTVHVRNADGDAQANGGLAVFDFSGDPRLVTLDGVRIARNRTTARSDHGTAEGLGGGVFTNSLLTLRHSTVDHNRVLASAPTATAQGGGIWNGPYLSGPPVDLTLVDSWITADDAATGPGGTRQGGGLFTTVPFTRVRTTIAGNRPDQCSGCSGAAPAGPTAAELFRRTR